MLTVSGLAYAQSVLPEDYVKLNASEKANWLIQHMTLSEKVEQLNYDPCPGSKTDDKYKIPRITALDGPRGVHSTNKEVCFPVPLALAATWDTSLVRRTGSAFAISLIKNSSNQLLSPALNIIKHPLAGRNAEYLGEDPFLSGQIASAEVKGIQDEGCIATPKHFCCNSFESGRFRYNIAVNERVLNEIYLPAFKECIVNGEAKSIMTAYNSVNGSYMAESKNLLDILFNQWKFSGYTISDWGAYIPHADSALNAGLFIEYPGWRSYNDSSISYLIKNGNITQELLDKRVKRILELKLTPGFVIPPGSVEKYNIEEQRTNACKAAENSIVLLKNEGNLLPLNGNKKILLTGPFANSDLLVGNQGSSTVFPERVISVKKALVEKGISFSYIDGCNALVTEDITLLNKFRCTGEYFNNIECEGNPVFIDKEDSIIKYSFVNPGFAEAVLDTTGSAIKTNGETSLRIGSFNRYNKDDEFSWTFRVKVIKADSVHPFVSMYLWGVNSINFTTEGVSLNLDNLTVHSEIKAEIPRNKWVLVTLQRQNNELKLLYDSIQVGEIEFNYPIEGAPIYLGGNPGIALYSECMVKDYCIYSRVLSIAEISSLVQGKQIENSRIFYEPCNNVEEILTRNTAIKSIANPSNMSARWTGEFIPLKSGKYYFKVYSNSGIRFYLDNKKIVDQWQEEWIEGQVRQFWLNLEEGKRYSIKLEFNSIFCKQQGQESYIKFEYAEPDNHQIEMINSATAEAAKANAVIIMAGVPQLPFQAEANDNESYSLPGLQDELIKSVSKENPNVIVLLSTAGGVDMSKWINSVKSVAEVFYPGQEGGYAVANMLFGDVNPSGKLPVTYPKNLDELDVNVVQPDFEKSVCAIGYRMFDKEKKTPQYVFGHGLSYTTYKYDNLHFEKEGDKVLVEFTITNTGAVAGAETPQVYVCPPKSEIERPEKELKGFTKVHLLPGQEKDVCIRLNNDAFSYYSDTGHKWVKQTGEFIIETGSSSGDIRLSKTIIIE